MLAGSLRGQVASRVEVQLVRTMLDNIPTVKAAFVKDAIIRSIALIAKVGFTRGGGTSHAAFEGTGNTGQR